MPDRRTWAAAAALMALALCLAVAAASSPALAQAPTRGQLRIQLSYLNGTYWEPWNSTKLTLYGTSSTFTIELWNETANQRLLRAEGVVPDAYGNLTLSVPAFATDHPLVGGYNLTINWIFTTSEGRRLNFRVFNGTLYFDTILGVRQLRFRWPSKMWGQVANWSRFMLNATALTVQAYDCMASPYGPNPLGGAQIIVINGTNWDRQRWADGSTPAILYNITTPESLPYAGRASFIVPNTTNPLYKPDVDKAQNYTLGLRVRWNGMLVYNMTLAQYSHNPTWVWNHPWPDVYWWMSLYRFSPYNFTILSQLVASRNRAVRLNCSVYAYKLRLVDYSTAAYPLGSTSDVEIVATMSIRNVTVGSAVIARPRTTDPHGEVALRYAAKCVDGEEAFRGPGVPSTRANLTVYWKSTKLGVEYAILNLTLGYGTIYYGRWTVSGPAPYGNATAASPTVLTTVSPVVLHTFANVTRIQVVDSTDKTYPQPLYENTNVYLTFPGALEQAVGVNASGIIDLSFCNYTLPLMSGGVKLNNYGIKVLYKGFKVLDTSFNPNVFERSLRYLGAFNRFFCSVYYLKLDVFDAHKRPLRETSLVQLKHPTGEVFNITVPGVTSSITDKVPGGLGYEVKVRYKSADLLTPLEGGSLNVTDNTALTVVAPIYDVYVKVRNWERTYWVEGLNVGFRWSFPTTWMQWGNMTSEVRSWSRAVEPLHYINLYQIPVGTHTLVMYVTRASPTPGLESYVDRYVVGEYSISVVDSDVYDKEARSWIYDPTFIIKTADGSTLPEYTTVANTTMLVTVFNVSSISGPITYNITNGMSSVTLYSNLTQRRVFVGGAKYNFTLYAGGVTVYGPTLTLPKGTDEVELTSNIYAVKFTTKDYYGAFGIPNLKVSISWTGLNYTYYNRTLTNWLARYSWMNLSVVWSNWTKFRDVVSDYAPWVTPATRRFMLYNVSRLTDASGEAIFYIPVWNYPKRPAVYNTSITFDVTTYPGKTPSIPSGLASRSVMDRHAQAPIYHSPWFLNVTKDVTQKTLNVYAANFTVVFTNEKAEPLAGYKVNVTIELANPLIVPRKRLIDSGVTGADGKVTFSSRTGSMVLFWCNYSYNIFAYKELKDTNLVDQDGKPVSFDNFVVGSYSLSANWAPGVTRSATFQGTIAVTALDAYSQPLAGQVVALKAANGSATGWVVGYGVTGADGKVFFYLPSDGYSPVYGYYNATDDTWRLGSSIFQVEVYWTKPAEGGKYKVFWPILIYGPTAVVPDASLAASCKVFYAKLRFVSDTGRALEWGAIKVPSGPTVGIPFKAVFYLGGAERSDVYAYEGVTMANATFNLVRCPVGDYKIYAWWPNFVDIKILDYTFSITQNLPGPNVPQPVHDLKTCVYDITLNFKTPKGTVCGNATAYIRLPQGVSVTEVTDSEGNVKLINVPSSVSTVSGSKYPLRVEKATWHGYDALTAAVEKDITGTTTYYILADNIVALNVRVLGARGQGLPYASVSIQPILTAVADESGLASVELPRRTYTVTATYKGKTGSVSVDLTDRTKVVFDTTVTLDVWIELFGYAMSAGEFALSILLSVIVVLVVAFIVHEYIVWRRKRIAAAVVKA
jgi:hypothetical protein